MLFQGGAFVLLCIGIAICWQQFSQPCTFSGQAEVVQVSVTSPETGVVTNLCVTPFQELRAGDRVAEVTLAPGAGSGRARNGDTPNGIWLRAPMDGAVTAIHRRAGEQVLAGQAVATVTARESQRILGYMPQALPVVPAVGMPVEVRTRAQNRKRGRGQVLAVGPNWEPVTNPAIHIAGVNGSQPVARPVLVSLPPGMRLMPGELVEITILR